MRTAIVKKIQYLDYRFLQSYVDKQLHPRSKKKLKICRNTTLSSVFNKGIAFVHQGRTFVKIKLSEFKVGSKAGEFAATKKPFNFRPKKKKEKR